MKRLLPSLIAALAVVLAVPQTAVADLPDPEPDTTPPRINITVPSGSIDGWYKDTVEVRIHVVDSHAGASGVAAAGYTLSGVSSGEGAISPRDGVRLTISTAGSTTIEVSAQDVAENQASATYIVGVDRTAPAITINPEVFDGAVYARGQSVPFTYSCEDDFVGLQACDASQTGHLNTSMPGSYLVSVTASDRLGNVRVRNANYLVVEPYFAIVQPPSIEGASQVGSEVTATGVRFSPEPDSVTYQWLRENVAIPGATSARYTPTAADVGTRLTVRATAKKTGFPDASSTSTGVTVQAATFRIASPAVLQGTMQAGEELTVGHGAVTPAPEQLSYLWLRNGSVIPGATNRSYRLGAADVGAKVTATVFARSPGYTDGRFVTPEGETVRPGTLSGTGAVTLSGAARVGAVLTAKAPVHTPTARLSHQWLRNGSAITGATGSTYRLTAADRGRKISVQVTATAAGYTPVSLESGATAAVVKAKSSIRTSTKARGKRKARVAIVVSATGVTATGKVTIKRGSKVIARKTLSRGRATVNLGRLPKGRTRLTVVYSGSSGVDARTVKTKRIKIR